MYDNGKRKELEIEILMKDKCTRREAINYLEKGAVIIPIEEWDEFVAQYDEQYKNSEDLEEYHKEYSIENIKNGKLADHSYIKYNNKEYIIEYVL